MTLDRYSQDSGNIDDLIEAGMKAGFGPTEEAAAAARGVVATLALHTGVHSHVLLRDASDGEGPIIRPVPLTGVEETSRLGRYHVAGELARGGVGIIYKGRDADLGRDVAIKLLQPHFADHPAMLQRFVEEAQIMGQLQHPGILPVYELGLRGDRQPFFSMKLVRGRTLAAQLGDRSQPADDRRRFLSIFEHICQTMAYAHARGVVHRDLKPSNVLVGAFGEVQVVDWGLAKVLTQGGLADDDRTAAASVEDSVFIQTVRSDSEDANSVVGSVMGTPAYMPPEQARGEVQLLDERSDVFALGAMLCEILTGAPPYVGSRSETLRMAVDARLEDAYDRLSRSGADEPLVQLTRRCLAADSTARPRDAGVVAREMSAYLAGLEDRARALEISAAESRAVASHERRVRRLTTALAALILVSVAVGALSYLGYSRERDRQSAKATETLNGVLDSAAVQLGEAQATPVGDMSKWELVLASLDRVRSQMTDRAITLEARQRAEALLSEATGSHRDRLMIERIEEIVISGATHEDKESWTRMEEQFREAFREYGIDLDQLPRDEIVARMRASPISVQLADGYELWIGTAFQLMGWGVQKYTIQELLDRVDLLHEADPDPIRTEIRRQLYAMQPDVTKLKNLDASLDYTRIQPRTLSWLASAIGSRGMDLDTCYAIFRKAVLIYPDDFMLNFDYAYHLAPMGHNEEAIRYYLRCLGIRPQTAGVWRSLGRAYRAISQHRDALDAFAQSVRYQPDHAPTHVDLGETRGDLDDLDGAVAAFREAVRLQPGLAIAHCRLGLALMKQGRHAEALPALRKGHELGSSDPQWKHPSADWVAECESALNRGPE